MSDRDVSSLLRYNEWANRRVFDAVAQLDGESFVRPLGSSFSSLRDTLAHLVAAEWLWLKRWEGESHTKLPDWAVDATVESLRDKLTEVEHNRADMFDSRDHDLDRQVTYTNFAGETWRQPLRELVVHVVNHASYHRGQIATMMRQLGAQPASTDYVVYMRELDPGARVE